MKGKKIMSFLLAAVMTLGLLPTSALAAGTQIGQTVGEGTYTDTTADPNKSYTYTVTGSDGSKQTITVPAVNQPAETGNKVVEHTGDGKVYYQKVNAKNAKNGTYLLVYKYGGQDYAVQNYHTGDDYNGYDVSATQVTVSNDKINEIHTDCEYQLERDKKNYQFKGRGGYLGNNEYSEVCLGSKKEAFDATRVKDGLQLSSKGEQKYWVRGEASLRLDSATYATTFYLYQKVTESTDKTWIVDTAGLDALLAQSFKQEKYTEDSWNTYAQAKAAAEAAKAKLDNPYTDKNAADAALAEIDDVTCTLDAAIKGLTKKPVEPVKPGQCTSPEITWHRTWETQNGEETVVGPIKHLESEQSLMDIIWKWDDIKSLKASDPNPWNAVDGQPNTAAKWEIGTGDDWTRSVVRRFTGTFTWPEGVGMDGEMTIQSVNDADYQFIYDYIAQPGNEELAKRYGGAKVLPINDDMYVFISKVEEDPTQWTNQQAKEHLMFWTGTTGKGRWSYNSRTGADWGRTEPARFNGVSATPAFCESWPNLEDRPGGTNWNVRRWELPVSGNPMSHTDSWYTLTDTNAMKSTLNSLYGKNANLGGQEMRIDIYAFNNSGTGGMDELQLVLCAAEKESVQVTVNYWLDGVNQTQLGSSVMTGKVGDVIDLPNGTNTNELNYKKGEAISQSAADANVSNGVQQQPGYVVKEGTNVIDVVYTRDKVDTQYLTYDFGVENRYTYKDTSTEPIKGVTVECSTDEIGVSYEGHDIFLTYTPKDSMGNPVNATLVVERDSWGTTENRYAITIIPASNVLYEEGEGFMATDQNSGWNLTPAAGTNAVGTVDDNESTVFGWTSAYGTTSGSNGVYSANLAAGESTAGDLRFSFRGRGFDLIGSCGRNTGTLLVHVEAVNGQTKNKNYVVDTSFKDSSIASMLYQIPVVHCAGLAAGEYDVSVRGLNRTKAEAPAVMSTDGSAAITPELYEALVDMGLTDEEIEEVEFINMDDQAEQYAVSAFAVEEPAAAGTTQTVFVDSFRVYRSSENSAEAYPENEQDVTYTNVMKDGIKGSITAYIEGTPDGSYGVADYEKAGGPQNEVYLANGQGVAFKLKDETLTKTQISARAVSGTAIMGVTPKTATDPNSIEIGHVTEMYYEVNVKDGLVIIANTGDNLLALGNLKADIVALNDKEQKQAVQMMTMMFAKPEETRNFNIYYELTEGAAWADGAPFTEIKATYMNSTVTTSVAPEVIAPEGQKLVRWDAVEIKDSLEPGEVLTAQYLAENFDWTGRETYVTYRPVFEADKPAEIVPNVFDLRFCLTDGASWTDGTPATRDWTCQLNATDGGVRVPAVKAPEGKLFAGWQAEEIAVFLKPGTVLTAQYLQDSFTWTEENPTVTFRPVFKDEPKFAPEFMDVTVTVEKGYDHKYATLKVETSVDAEYITVDGERLRANNYIWVKWGFDDHYVYTVNKEFPRNGEVSFRVVAYDRNGNAGETILARE